MALETVVFQQDPFSSSSYPYKEYSYPYGLGSEYEITDLQVPNYKTEPDVAMSHNVNVEWDVGMNSSSSMEENFSVASAGRRKRQRARVVKNKEEVESQRMTHIAVERNRRKQMNEYLAVLRSMMPSSYVHRGDQASIIGGAVNFVKELEQLLQSLKAAAQPPHVTTTACADLSSSPFADFFTFPQYSTDPTQQTRYAGPTASSVAGPDGTVEAAIADVEVTMVDSHANIKVLSRKQPKQLVKMVVGLQCLCLSILHLNVTTVHDMVLYSFSVKAEENCELTSVNEIATAVYEMVGRIQEEAKFS